MGQVLRWHFVIPKNVSECRSVRTRDWRWDDLREERSPGPQPQLALKVRCAD
ncbi:hypothetical protein AXF42_Ash018191 [Apostasia shenzhenica]|uniref:Uncharacterized protein n=1 Tax=Apostasia shenzhenica TaxID=1088818 RepID=A0A2I0B1B3_9ASPA|nr:hypothetical protein AXF42_Ash018191 [Apostasia shenzhenica]